MWGYYYATVNATSSPTTGGYVYVGTNSNCGESSCSSTSNSGTGRGGGLMATSGNVTLYLCHKTNSGYVFKGWATSTDANSGSGANSNPWSNSFSASYNLDHSGTTHNYYAIYATLQGTSPASGSTVSFSDTNVGDESDWKEIKIKAAHAGTVTISQSGNHGDFLVVSSTTTTTEFSSFSSVAEETKSIYVKFIPTTNGSRSCTLTISSNNGLSSLSYTLTGTGYNKPSIVWVDGEGNELTSGETTLSAGDILRAKCPTGQAISYSNYNTSYFTAGTDSEKNPILTVREDINGTINNLSVTANLAKNTTNYYAAYSEAFALNITNLTPQTIEWPNDLASISDEEIGHTITLNAVAKNAKTGANSGQTITYSMAANDYLSLSGNVLTVKAVGGPVAITATATGNANYATASVTKYATVIDMSHPCASTDTHSDGQFVQGSVHDIYPTLPTKVTFTAKRESSWLWKDLVITQYKANGTVYSTTTKSCDDISTSGTQFTVDSDPSVTQIRFAASASAKYTYYITNISTTRKTESSVDKTALSYETDPGQSLDKQVKVTYSNIPVFLTFKSDEDAGSTGHSLWSLSTKRFGGCGKSGSQTVTVTFLSEAKGSYTDKLYVRNNVGTLLHTIDLSATVTGQTQFLDAWNIADAYNTTDQVTLSASTTVGNTNFTFTPTASNPNGIVMITNAGVMTFTASGSATIRAYQPGDALSNEFETSHNITINKVTPSIATNPSVATIKYLDNLNNNQLSEGLATVTFRGVANTTVEGAFEWTTPKQITDKAGNYTHSITFKPTNTGMYNNKVFDQTITITRADASIVMNDGSVKVKIVGVNDDLNEWKIDLDNLIKSQTTDNIAASRAGAVSYKVLSDNAEYASIDGNHIFAATRCGEYTVEVTKAQTDWYVEARDTFVVTVEKLDPVVVFDNTDDPQVLYTLDMVELPAARYYNGHEIGRTIVYTSAKPAVLKVNTLSTWLTAMEVQVNEGESVPVTVTAYSAKDDFYNQSETVEKNYAIYAKRSPHFTMEGHTDEPVSKTLQIGETATITYNENTDASFTVGTSGEHGYVTFTRDAVNRVITVTAVKGNLSGDGEQVITLTQPGTTRLYQRQINYTFTVQRHVSTMSLEPLVTSMNVEDTVSAIFANVANPDDEIQFSCVPEGSMKMENGKLIALQAGTNTVTFTQPNTECWTGITQSKTINVSKLTPQINCSLENSHPWYSIIRHPFTSTNTMEDSPITITSSDETLAKYIAEEDKIVVYGTSGNVTFTFNQPGNYKYKAVQNYTKTFTIYKPNNGLPMTLTSDNWKNYRSDYQGSISWDDGGLLLGNSWKDWSAKYIILHFTGVPDQLSFDFQNSSMIATQYGWHFYQSSTGEDGSWVVLKEYDDLLMNATGGTSEGSEQLALLPSTRYVRLEYHGNYGGRFKNVSISERKEIIPRAQTVDFGLGYNGNEPTTRSIALDWYNVNNCEVSIIGENADRFILAEGDEVINSLLDNYGDATLHVSYKHDVNTATTHTATLHIVEKNPNGTDGQTADVTLVGQTTQAPQMIIWREDLSPMPSEGEFSGAAYSTSGLDIELTSLNPEIVRVGGEDGLTLYPVSPGVAQVRAYQAGDDKWAEVTDIIDIEVTTKHVQYITWNDNLSNLKREENKTKTVNLTASASSGLGITYTLDAAASQFASIDGNVLTLTGWGTGYITARQAGDDEYVAVQKKKKLVSRNPNAGCNPTVEEDSYPDGHTIWTLGVREIGLTGEPGSIEFDAKCSATALYGLWVGEFYDGYWHEVKQISRFDMGTSYSHYGPYNLTRRATAVRIYTETGATMNRTFKNVEVKLAKYIELESNEMNFAQLDKGATKVQSFYVNYSNITGAFDVALENASSQFEVLTTTIGEDCGDAAKNVRIDIKCTGKNAGVENNAIIISNYDQYLRVPVSANVVLPSQAITWNPDVTERNIKTTDAIELIATATSGLDVNLESNNTEVAEVVNNGGVYTLNIHKYGDVTITASQAGNDSWSPAVDKPVVFHISRVVPVIIEYPTTESIFSSHPLSECALNGGAVEGNIPGEFRWVNPEQVITYENTVYQAMFLPENTNYYEPVIFDVTLDVISNTQTITWSMPEVINAKCADVIEFDAVASSGLPITYVSSDSLIAYVENTTLRVIKYGTVTITATQPGDSRYLAATPLNTQIHLTRNSLTVETKPEVTQVYVGHSLSDAKFVEDGVVKAGEIVVDGKYSWQEDPIFDTIGKYTFTAIFTPYNIGWYEPVACDVEVEVISAYVFTGNGTWDHGTWHDDRKPDGGGNDDVIIADSASLTVTDDAVEIRDLNVSGELVIGSNASVTVTGDLILEATLGGKEDELTYYTATSGQLTGEELSDSLKVNGDVYFQLTFDPRGYIDFGWYSFVLPFDVDVDGGLFFKDKTPMVYGVDFMMAEFSESKRAKNEKSWENYRGTMQAGKAYMITFDETRNLEGRQALNTVLFKKKDGAELGASNSYTPEYTPSGDNSTSGWNGIGNGTLTYRELSRQVQVYDHMSNSYTGYDANECSFAIGTSFFVQATSESTIVLEEASESRAVLAPAREQRGTDEFRVALTAENANVAADRLWFSASEDATDEYVIGKDLAKMGTTTDSKVARMWTRKGEIDLCDIETVLNNNQAEIELSFFAPKDGTYELAIEKAPENTDLYLTYNGRIIWDLMASPYVFDLTKGTTEGYGLLMDARAPQTTEGVDNIDAEGQTMRKVLIDNVIYIITPEGAMYDVTGKFAK